MSQRTKNRGLVLLRRSGDRQETSLEKQLTWAIAEAQRLDVSLEATLSDVDHMQRKSLSTYRGIRLDDAIPGD